MTKKSEKQSIDMTVFNPKNNFSIPNIISTVRLLLIPFILYFYIKGNTWLAVSLVAISGLTDALDGYIARHYNQITPLGKMLDPLADKLTQIALGVCLITQFPAVIPLVIVLVTKELLMLIWGLRLLRAGLAPFSALWWGKVATIAFYAGALIIMAFSKQLGGIGVTIISIAITLLMLYSMVRYGQVFKEKINSAQK